VEHPEIIPDLSNDSGDSTARTDPLPNSDAAKYHHTMSDDTTVIAHAPSSTSSPDELPAAGASFIGQRKPRVLVVDDNSANLTHSINFMKKRNLTVLDAADNGKIALDVVEGTLQGYDLIFMDLSMPVMDGFEATRLFVRLKKNVMAASRRPSPGSLDVSHNPRCHGALK
jgi:PleD family two-component response regulator